MWRVVYTDGRKDIGFNTRSWLDAAGHEQLIPMEYICQENNVDVKHLVGK